MEIKQYTLNLWINDDITRRIGKYYETSENENRCPHLWDSVKSSAKWVIHSSKCLYFKKKRRRTISKQQSEHLKEL